MEVLTPEEFARDAAEFDAAVAASADIDRFCSSSAWALSAHEAFHGAGRLIAARSESGWLALSREEVPGVGMCLSPLEAMWGLACPLAGPEPVVLAREAAETIAEQFGDWKFLRLGGLRKDSVLFHELAAQLGRRFQVRAGFPLLRWAASLEGGAEGWLSRRSRKFRAGLRHALAKSRDAGVAFEWFAGTDDAEALYTRIVRIEARSWKGLSGTGFAGGGMREFYERLVARLAAKGRLRALIATLNGEDVAFQFGGIFGDTYRGLQLSFDERFRELSLGNVLQSEMIARLVAPGLRWYDLGTDMEYKSHWAEAGLETVTILAVSR
ncbi:MAG: GNAT family N-acetyltransferase [Planctomycetes bacterium]|nr:GNAT family N-acetyltransferase [Planctomycetota bacterium]